MARINKTVTLSFPSSESELVKAYLNDSELPFVDAPSNNPDVSRVMLAYPVNTDNPKSEEDKALDGIYKNLYLDDVPIDSVEIFEHAVDKPIITYHRNEEEKGLGLDELAKKHNEAKAQKNEKDQTLSHHPDESKQSLEDVVRNEDKSPLQYYASVFIDEEASLDGKSHWYDFTPDELKEMDFDKAFPEGYTDYYVGVDDKGIIRTNTLDNEVVNKPFAEAYPNFHKGELIHPMFQKEQAKEAKSHLVVIHLKPEKKSTVEKAYQAMFKAFRKMGWELGKLNDKTHTFLASKEDNHLECKPGKNGLSLIGSIKDKALDGIVNGIKKAASKVFSIEKVEKKEPTITLTDKEFIDHYAKRAEEIDKLLQKAIKDGYAIEPDKEVMKQKPGVFLADQYTGTSLEGNRLKSFLHQELQTMKRFGLVKENEQTGKLTVGKGIEKEHGR